jgi:signal transduction histidine kinase
VGTGELDEGRLLLELSREVTASLDLQVVLDRSLAALRRLIDFNGGSIQLIIDGHLQMVAGDPAPPPEAFAFRLPLGEGFGGRVAATGELLYSADATTDPRAHPEGRRRASVAGTHSWFGAPLIWHGEIIGIVQLDDLTVDHFPPPIQARILSFLPTVTAAVQNALLYTRERDAVLRLQEAEQLKRDFVAMVSHELKTPLTIVRGYAGVLAGALPAPSEIASMGQRIDAAAVRLEHAITDLLHIAGFARGGVAIALDRADVADVVRRAADGVGPQRVVVQVEDPLPLARTDGAQLAQVLAKLLDNAARFSDATSTITLRALADGDAVVVTVTDEGQGIAAEQLERIFEPFVQGDPSTSGPAGGMGTGLFLARSIGAAIGATVSVSSTLGDGSTFTVRMERA